MNDNQKGLKNQDLIGCQLRLYLHKAGEVKKQQQETSGLEIASRRNPMIVWEAFES